MNFYRHSTAVALVLAISGGMIVANAPAKAQSAEECLAKLRQVEQNLEQANLTAAETRELDTMRREVRQLSKQGEIERCNVVVSEVEAYVAADTKEQRAAIVVQRAQPEVTVQQAKPQVSVQQPEPRITVRQSQPEVTVSQAKPQVSVRVPEPQVTVRMPKPQVTIEQGQPEVSVSQAEPQVSVEQARPDVQVAQKKPEVDVQMANPEVNVRQAQPEVIFDQPKPRVVVQEQQPEVMVEQQQAAVTVEQSEPEVRTKQAEASVAVRQQEPEVNVQQGEPKVRVQQQKASVDIEQQDAEVNVRDRNRQAGTDTRGDRKVNVAASDGATTALSEESREAVALAEREGRTGNPVLSMRADELVGSDVYGMRGDEIGEIEEVLLGAGNKVFIVIGAGGFLGIGDHDVAVPVDRLNQQGSRLILSSETEASLEEMPEYDERAGDYEPIERTRRPVDYMR